MIEILIFIFIDVFFSADVAVFFCADVVAFSSADVTIIVVKGGVEGGCQKVLLVENV